MKWADAFTRKKHIQTMEAKAIFFNVLLTQLIQLLPTYDAKREVVTKIHFFHINFELSFFLI